MRIASVVPRTCAAALVRVSRATSFRPVQSFLQRLLAFQVHYGGSLVLPSHPEIPQTDCGGGKWAAYDPVNPESTVNP